jgi:hypothetical protein
MGRALTGILWNANGQIMLPPPHAVEVYSNRQPVLRGSFGEDLDAKDALDAFEWGVLPFVDGINVGNGGLANDLQLQQPPQTTASLKITCSSRQIAFRSLDRADFLPSDAISTS